MPDSIETICNLALRRIGLKTRIVSFAADTTQEAAVLRDFWTTTLEDALRSMDPRFARRTATLALLYGVNGDPATLVTRVGWGFVYALPVDCLMPRFIWTGERRPRPDQIPAMEETCEVVTTGLGDVKHRTLCTDEKGAVLIYTARHEEVTLWDGSFKRAIAAYLASEIAAPLAADARLAQLAKQEWMLIKQQAMAIDMNSQKPDPEPDSIFISSRS